MSCQRVRDHLDFREAVFDWVGKLREHAKTLGPSIFKTAPGPFDSPYTTPGNIGGASPSPITGLTTPGNIAGSSATTYVRTGVQTSNACAQPASGDGAHWPDSLCERANCGEDILPIDTLGAAGFPIVGPGTATLAVQLSNVRTFLPYYFFMMGLDSAAGLAQIPARLVSVTIGPTNQLIAPNLNSLVLTTIGQRIGVRWGLMDSTLSGTPNFTFGNDLAGPAALRVIGMVQGEPNVQPMG